MEVLTKMIYAIGDIHGDFRRLKRLWNKIAPTKEDLIIFLGDYIDRGESPKKVISMIMTWKNRGFDIITLRGNHEDMYLSCLRMQDIPAEMSSMSEDEMWSVYRWNGGWKTIANFDNLPPPKRYLDFLKQTKSFCINDDYIFVHAGLKPGVSFDEQKYDDMLWIRDEFIYSRYDFGKIVIFGHTPFIDPYVDQYKIGIDTGAVFGGKLTCLALPAMDFIQV